MYQVLKCQLIEKKKMRKILFFSTKVNFEQFHEFKSTEF